MPVVFRSVKELKERTPKVLKDAQRADVIVTVHGKPQAILRRFTEEEFGEALARSEVIRKGLEEGIADVHAGRVVPRVPRLRAVKSRARRA